MPLVCVAPPGVIEITGLRPFLFGGMLGVIEITGLTPLPVWWDA